MSWKHPPGLRVYIAGPLSKDPIGGVRNACQAADRLMSAGHFPYIPHLDRMWAYVSGEKPYEMWIQSDFVWISVCQALVRIPGESPGADREVRLANELGIPVYYGVDAFLTAHGLANVGALE